MANCEKCDNEPGSPYTFLYGNADVSSATSGSVTTTTHRYHVDGEETALVGQQCIDQEHRRLMRQWLTWVWILVGVTGVGVGLALAVVNYFWALAFFAAIAAIMFGAIAGNQHGKRPETRGEDIAIGLRKKALEDRGFGLFWTHEAWENTRKTLKQ